jgi:hypothetical protein
VKRKRKPDIMILLATLIGLGVLTTGLVQGAMQQPQAPAAVTAQK